MTDLTQPLLALYVVWHPESDLGHELASSLYEHFRRPFYQNVATSSGVEVLYRSDPSSASTVPPPVPFDGASTTAVVALTDSYLAADAHWTTYVQELSTRADARGLHVAVIPVALEPGILNTVQWAHQAARWDEWTGSRSLRTKRLIGTLTEACCRLLRHHLAQIAQPSSPGQSLDRYLHKIPVFISHTKRDASGRQLSRAIRNHIHTSFPLNSFLDVYDIPVGIRFHTALLHNVSKGALLSIRTDSYSSREWCRREVLEAKRHNVPFVVVDCLTDLDDRSFPYGANVPAVRLDCADPERIDHVLYRLLDELLKDYLWRLLVSLTPPSDASAVTFLPRPPELLSLAGLTPARGPSTIVYPDPPLSAEEQNLFAAIAPEVELRTRTQWLAVAGS